MFVVPSFFGFQDAGKLDPDYLAFYARVVAAGGSLTTTEQTATLQLVLDLKDYGIWTKIKAAYPMVGGGTGTTAARQAACSQNLKSSSFTGTFTSGWTYASTGVTGDGVSAYMDTFYNTSVENTLSNGFLGVYLRTNSAGNPTCDIGNYNGSNSATTIYARFNNAILNRWNDVVDFPTISTNDSRGWRYVNRNLSTEKKVGVNSTITTVIAASVAQINAKIYLSALSSNNSASQFSNRECAFACIGEGLTDTEATNFYTAVQTFQTTLSRQV